MSPVEPTVAPVSPSTPRPPVGRLALFIALVLAASSLLSLPFALGMLPVEAAALVVPVAQLSPLLAVLLVRRRSGQLREDLGLVVSSGRSLALGLALGLVVFTVVPLLRVMAGVTSGLTAWSLPDGMGAVLVALPVIAVLQTILAFGEETGWRGWLHGVLAPHGYWVTALVTAALWTLWHLPVVLALGMSVRESVSYLVTITAVSPVLTALRALSGSVVPAVLGHGLLNSLRVAIEQNLTTRPTPEGAWLLDVTSWSLWLLTGLVLCAIATRSGVARERGLPIARS